MGYAPNHPKFDEFKISVWKGNPVVDDCRSPYRFFVDLRSKRILVLGRFLSPWVSMSHGHPWRDEGYPHDSHGPFSRCSYDFPKRSWGKWQHRDRPITSGAGMVFVPKINNQIEKVYREIRKSNGISIMKIYEHVRVPVGGLTKPSYVLIKVDGARESTLIKSSMRTLIPLWQRICQVVSHSDNSGYGMKDPASGHGFSVS